MTVGVVRPVVLLPVSWTDLDDESARAILLHETLHVQRRDWLRVCAEEAWCAVLWFHPGARLLVTRLDTAREMLVDHVVAGLGGRAGLCANVDGVLRHGRAVTAPGCLAHSAAAPTATDSGTVTGFCDRRKRR